MVIIGLGGYADAYHDGGVAYCSGCHTMHSQPALGTFLLIGTDQSSTCLNCHQAAAGTAAPSSFHVATAPSDMPTGVPPIQRSPGGDFGWLSKTYTYTAHGSTTTELGSSHGHNIVAVDYGYLASTVNTTAPGGTFLSSTLSCVSCHNPHGVLRYINGSTTPVSTGAPIFSSGSYGAASTSTLAVGVYRLLGGAGYSQQLPSGVTFVNPPPIAVAPSTYNRTEATIQTKVAYGVGMALWCSNCHPGMHNSTGTTGTAGFVHPVDVPVGSSLANNYNAYIGSGNMTGSQTNSYLSLVPYEENTNVVATLTPLASYTLANIPGPSSSANVMCLTCHRVHGSGWQYIGRWNFNSEFLVYNGLWPGTDNASGSGSNTSYSQGRLTAETQAAYYDRPASTFATYQRSLCNKCHALD